jgi:transcription elongation factor GreA
MAASKEVILTLEGKAKLEEELRYLENEKRAEVGERIKIAREFGDISENSEYDDAKNEQAWMESRIAEISQVLSNAVIADTPKRGTKVSIGSTVTLIDPMDKERVLQVVGTAEADPAEGKISNESPVGAALLGRKKGDVIKAVGPTGKKIEFTILKIAH